eukprot:2780285-Rhodomonas_salina.3
MESPPRGAQTLFPPLCVRRMPVRCHSNVLPCGIVWPLSKAQVAGEAQQLLDQRPTGLAVHQVVHRVSLLRPSVPSPIRQNAVHRQPFDRENFLVAFVAPRQAPVHHESEAVHQRLQIVTERLSAAGVCIRAHELERAKQLRLGAPPPDS